MSFRVVCGIFLILGALSLPLRVSAQEGEHDHNHSDHNHEAHMAEQALHNGYDHLNTASLTESWQLMQQDKRDIKAAVASGDGAAIHDLGLRLEATTKGMAKHRGEVDEGEQDRFDAYISQMTTLSFDLHKSGKDANLEESQKIATQVEGMMLLFASVITPSS